MAPRPRNTANKNLPQNLYFDARRSTYRYRRPTDRKWFQFGADRIKAIDAAKQLNLEFMRGADLVRAVLPHRQRRSPPFSTSTKRTFCRLENSRRARSVCMGCTSGASESSSTKRQ